MKPLSESILDLLKVSAAIASETQSERLAEATTRALDAMGTDGLIGATEAWVYQSIMQGMVRSGALKLEGHGSIEQRIPSQG
jgi:hypothetical protein